MEKNDNTPMWVFLAFSALSTRKGALLLIASCLLFTVYCVPWSLFFPEFEWVGQLFLINDWSWFVMMVPMLLWYRLSLRWMDKNMAWENEKE